MGIALLMSGELAAAKAATEKSLAIEDNPVFLSNLGMVEYYLGDYDRSASTQRRAIAQAPNSEVTWGNLADALYFAGNRSEARDAFRKVVSLANDSLSVNPVDVQALYLLAWGATMSGEAGSGAQAMQRAMTLAPEDAYVQYYRALIATRAGDDETALAAIRKAVSHGYPVALLRVEPYLAALRQRGLLDPLLARGSDKSGD